MHIALHAFDARSSWKADYRQHRMLRKKFSLHKGSNIVLMGVFAFGVSVWAAVLHGFGAF